MGNKQHRKTWDSIFANIGQVAWDDFVALVIHLGGTVEPKEGSIHIFRLNGLRAVFHEPHPSRFIYQTDRKRIRRFLADSGAQLDK